MSDLNVKVVIRNVRADGHRRVNVDAGLRELEAWDGDQQLVLSRDGPSTQNLSRKIEELRMRPQLATLSVPATRGVQDTLMLWNAWKNSMLETLFQMFEARAHLQLQQICDQDDTATRHRIRDLVEQLNTTLASWRSQVKFLIEERVQLVSNLNDRIAAENEAFNQLNRQDKTKSIYRVLTNAVKAVDHTLTEKLDLWQKRSEMDYSVHIQSMQGLFKGLLYCHQTFCKDSKQLKQQATDAQREIDTSIYSKQEMWTQVCQKQFADYMQSLHNPLAKMIKEIDPSAPGNSILQQSLDNANDPHCLRRCEVSLMLLRQAQSNLIGNSIQTTVDLDADDILQYAQRERAATEAQEHQKYTERWIALQSEHSHRERVIKTSRERLQQLQITAQQIQNNLHQTFENSTAADPKKLAVATRLAEQQLRQLKEDIQHTTENIAMEKRSLENMNLTNQDRNSIIRLILEATYKVYNLCLAMKSKFEAATKAENLLRHMIHHQCTTGINDVHQICQSTIYRMVQMAQSQFATVQVNLDRLQDAYSEAGRRIDTLHRGRIEQEERGTGDEIKLYRLIEEYADALTKKHIAKDSVSRAEFVCKLAQGSAQFLEAVVRSFESNNSIQ